MNVTIGRDFIGNFKQILKIVVVRKHPGNHTVLVCWTCILHSPKLGTTSKRKRINDGEQFLLCSLSKVCNCRDQSSDEVLFADIVFRQNVKWQLIREPFLWFGSIMSRPLEFSGSAICRNFALVLHCRVSHQMIVSRGISLTANLILPTLINRVWDGRWLALTLNTTNEGILY